MDRFLGLDAHMSSLTTPALRTGAVWEETWLALGAGFCASLGVGRAAKTVKSLVLGSSPLSSLVPGRKSCFLVTALPIPIRRISESL